MLTDSQPKDIASPRTRYAGIIIGDKPGRAFLDKSCRNRILHQALDFTELGLSINRLIEIGKQVAEKARLEYDPERGMTFDLFLRWRLKAAFHDLAKRHHMSLADIPESRKGRISKQQ